MNVMSVNRTSALRLLGPVEQNAIARQLDPNALRMLMAAGLLGGAGITGVAIDGVQGDDQDLIDNALVQALGTGSLATGVGAGLGAYSGDRAYNRQLQDAQADLTAKQVRARDIQNRSPNADMRVPLRNAADASNNLKQLRGQQSAFRGRGARRAVGVTAAGAALANLVNSFANDPEILEGNARIMAEPEEDRGIGLGNSLLLGAGLLAATGSAAGYDDGMSSVMDDVMKPGYYYMDETEVPTSRDGSRYNNTSQEKPEKPKAPKDMTSAGRELLRRKGLL